MNCPRCGDSGLEAGPNCRVKIELPETTIKKMVCESCAKTFADNITEIHR